MHPKLAIIHTTPLTIDSLKSLASELLPEVEVVNFLDDTVLPELLANGGDLKNVKTRLLQYSRFAEQAGANVLLSACSSVGEVVAELRKAVAIPVVRIDEAMAREAVRRSVRIGVAATLPTTLHPTLALISEKADEAGRQVTLEPLCVEKAYARLLRGDREGHDRVLLEALAKLAGTVEVVVLAQASMARVLPSLPAALQDKFLSSPRLGMLQVQDVLSAAVA